MKVDIDELGPVQRKVRVELPAEAVAGEFSRAYKNLGQRVRIKGFRTGKIPRHVLQGIYGDDVVSEVRSHLVEDALGEVIKDRGLQIVSRPEVESQDLHEGTAFSFSAIFEVKPQFEINDYLGVEIEKVKLTISEAQVDEALHRRRKGYAGSPAQRFDIDDILADNSAETGLALDGGAVSYETHGRFPQLIGWWPPFSSNSSSR